MKIQKPIYHEVGCIEYELIGHKTKHIRYRFSKGDPWIRSSASFTGPAEAHKAAFRLGVNLASSPKLRKELSRYGNISKRQDSGT